MSTTIIFFLYMIPATVLLGLYDIFVKKLLGKNIDERFLISLIFGFGGLISLVISLFIGFPEIKDGFLIALAGTSLLNTFAMWFWYKAYQKEDVSIISPIRLISPPLILITSFFILEERPTLWGVVGVFVIITGLVFLLETKITANNLSFKKIKKYSGILFAFIGAILFSFSFPLDKQMVITSSSIFSMSLLFIIISILNFIISCVAKKDGEKFWTIPKTAHYPLFVAILVFTVGSMLALESLNYSLAGYASSVKRLSVLWAVIFSGIFLYEKKHEKRIIATIIMLAGLSLIALLG